MLSISFRLCLQSIFSLLTLFAVGQLPAAYAANITPNTINVDLVVDQTVNIERTLTLDSTGPAANLVDVIFLADNTGSMGGVINTVRSNAHQILDAISGGDPRFAGIDVQFGVASYNGDPREFGGTPQARALNAYRLHQAITQSRTAVNTALSKWVASGGGDAPEANFFALHQVATSGGVTDGKGSSDSGLSTGYNTGWRPGAARVVVWFGDITSHTTTVDIDEAIAALKNNKVIVAAINSGSANSGIDGQRQASTIVAATGGSLTNNVQGTQTTINAILNAVQNATAKVDLTLATRGDTSGVTVQFSCISPEGCNAVAPGESRRFNMQIRGRALGDYSFETYAPQINGAVAQDVVHVRNCVSKVDAFAKRDKVELIWTHSGAGQYAIYRSDRTNTNYQLIGKTNSRYSVYVDRGLATDTKYFYQVKELDAAGNSVCSSLEVGATTSSRARPDTTPINLPPVISSTAPASALEDASYVYEVSATDPNGDAISFALVQAPAGMQINNNRITWTPGNHQVGKANVIVRAQDPAGLFADQIFTIQVANTNDAPQILSSAPVTARVDQLYEYHVNAVDIDLHDVLQYSLSVAPAGMTIDNTGKVRWTPAFLQQGVQSVTLKVSDAAGLFAEESFTITVEAVNKPPRITSTPLLTVIPGGAYSYQLQVVDPNEGDIRQFRLLEGPSGLTVNENTGLIEWPSAVVGTHPVAVEVRDYAGLTDTQSFELVVQLPNAAPAFTSSPVLSANEGTVYRYKVTASDANGDALVYSLVESPTGMTINSTGGEISWTPVFSQVGIHSVIVQVSDGKVSTQQAYSLAVIARANSAPVFNSVPVSSVITGEAYSYQANAIDAESDPVTYSLIVGAPGLTVSPGGLIQWLAAAPGSYLITIAASDNRGAASNQNFTLQVLEKPNTAPVISSSPVTSIVLGGTFTYSVAAADADGDSLTTNLVSGPLGLTLTGNTLTWTPTSGQLGLHPVEVRVTDGRGAYASQRFTIAVNDKPNTPPAFTSTPVTSVVAGSLYQYQLQATDSDGDGTSFSVQLAPPGADLSVGALFRWQTTDADQGAHTIRVRVTDSRGAYSEQAFVLNVQAVVDLPPVISSSPVTHSQVGSDYSYPVLANDPEGKPVNFSLTQAPAGMTISSSGVISWSPSHDQIGSHPVAVRVSDGKNSVVQNFTVQVSEPGQIDVSINLSSNIVSPDQTVTIQVLAPGAVNPTYQLTVNGTPLLLDAAGVGVFSASISGIYQLEARVTGSDGASGTAQSVVRVKVVGDSTPPVATINTPVDGAVILDSASIIGSVTDTNLYRYRLFVAEAGSTEFTEFASGSAAVTNSSLGSFNPSLLKNGLYQILLRAEDINGLETQDTVDIRVEGEFKPGVVQLSFVDMTVPVAGIPITIERTYDSRVKSQRDLGVGWNLSIRQGEYKNNREPGKGWSVVSSGGFLKTPCFNSVEQAYHLTDIRLSEREAYQFRPRFNLFGFGSVIGGGCLGQVEFVQVSGPAGAVLQPIGTNSVVYLNGTDTFTFDLGDEDFGEPWQPTSVRLTAPDGRVFDLDLSSGITRLQNANGNQLFISNGGVVNSSGEGVVFIRDASGKIAKVRDPQGNEVRYSYDTNNNLTGFTNQLNEQTTYQYYPAPFAHHLKSITLPDGKVISQFEYDAEGRLSKSCDADGCARADYDVAGRTQTNIDATNRILTYVYDQKGNVTSKRDALGNTETFNYDANGNLLEHRDALGNLTSRTWDANGNMLSITQPHEPGANPADFTTTYSYDSKGNLLTAAAPSGAKIISTYDSRGNLLRITNEAGELLSEATYDSSGRQLSESDPFGVLNYTWGANGKVSRMVDQDGVETTFTHNSAGRITGYSFDGVNSTLAYDAMGRETSLSYSDGLTLNYTYGFGSDWNSVEGSTIGKTNRTFSNKGAPAEITDADGSTNRWEYDAAGRVLAEIDPLNNRTSYSYDAAGRLVEETDPLGNHIRYELDANGRTLAEINGENERKHFSYFPDGRLQSTRDATNRMWLYQYTPTSVSVRDPLGRSLVTETNPQGLVTKVINADGTERRWTYLVASGALDGGDKPTSFTDEANRTRNFIYDPSGQMISATDFAGNAATYTYGRHGLLSAKDAGNQTISFAYTTFGEVSRLSFADGSFKEFDYDAQRRIKSVSLADGSNRQFNYDLAGRLLSDIGSDGNAYSFTWDKNSNLLSASDAWGTADFTYNAKNALMTYSNSTDEQLSYDYDRAGRVTSQTLANASGSQKQTTLYDYDDAGRLLTIHDPKTGLTRLTYDAAGRLHERHLPNGIVASFTYDDRDQVKRIRYVNGLGEQISSVMYDRRAGGEPEKITWADGSYVELHYDPAVRVVEELFYAADGSLQRHVRYDYDLAGNRTVKTINASTTNFAYGAGHRLLSATGAENHSYGYDANGWITRIARAGQNTNLTYNLAGQLASVSGAGGSVSYVYDAAGRRIGVSNGSSTLRALRANPILGAYENPQAIFDQDSNLVQSFLYAGDTPLLRTNAAGTVYYLTDAMGSVIGLTDESGNLLGSVKYDAYGVEFDQTGDMAIPTAAGGDFRFHGQWKDGNTGFYYMRARDYDPVTGRFLSTDPAEPNLGEPESLNRYAFANNNPYLYSDPSGRFTLVSVNISLNIQATLRSIAVNILKDYFIDKATSVVGSMLLGGLKNFTALASFNPWGSGNPAQAGKAWEREIQSFICSFVPSGIRDIVWFEPTISGSKASSNGYHCPGGGGGFSAPGSSRPDFMLSKTQPVDLGDVSKGKGSIKAYLIGETKLSLKTYYDAYVKGKNRRQFNNIMEFAQHRVYARTAIFLALYNGGKNSALIQRELSLLLTREAVARGVVPVMVSAI